MTYVCPIGDIALCLLLCLCLCFLDLHARNMYSLNFFEQISLYDGMWSLLDLLYLTLLGWTLVIVTKSLCAVVWKVNIMDEVKEKLMIIQLI